VTDKQATQLEAQALKRIADEWEQVSLAPKDEKWIGERRVEIDAWLEAGNGTPDECLDFPATHGWNRRILYQLVEHRCVADPVYACSLQFRARSVLAECSPVCTECPVSYAISFSLLSVATLTCTLRRWERIAGVRCVCLC
jgi:hypothetical protein